MNPASVPAHFDGERILLDEPVELEPDTRLMVTILPNSGRGRNSWLRLSAARLSEAYDGDGDEYALDSIKDLNPEHEGS